MSPSNDNSKRQYTHIPPRVSPSEKSRFLSLFRSETMGGVMLVFAAVIAITWANSPWAESYFALKETRVGFEALHLDLTLGSWASDGLLAIFFFTVGLELKREFVAGDLRNFSKAIVPISAAVGGVILPAFVYIAVVLANPDFVNGWAIPTATDIAFAVAVLALIGSKMPSALRIFLLTLAVVDDLIAITIIALFFSDDINYLWLLASFVVIGIYGFIAQYYRKLFALRATAAWTILFPIGIVAWAFMHASGIHATISGVLLAFTVPVLVRKEWATKDNSDLASQFEHRFGPLSSGFAVPIFAFFSAGVAVGGLDGFVVALQSPVTIGVVVALVAGKPIGITLTSWLMTRLGPVRLDPEIKWIDLFGVGILAGIGFTVSLLIAELSFDPSSAEYANAKIGILVASVIASAFAALILVPRNRKYARIRALSPTGDLS